MQVAILYREGSALSMYTRTLGLQGHERKSIMTLINFQPLINFN